MPYAKPGQHDGADADQCPGADPNLSAKPRTRSDMTKIADVDIVVDECQAVDDEVAADGCRWLNDRPGTHQSPGADRAARADLRAAVYHRWAKFIRQALGDL